MKSSYPPSPFLSKHLSCWRKSVDLPVYSHMSTCRKSPGKDTDSLLRDHPPNERIDALRSSPLKKIYHNGQKKRTFSGGRRHISRCLPGCLLIEKMYSDRKILCNPEASSNNSKGQTTMTGRISLPFPPQRWTHVVDIVTSIRLPA